MKIHNGAALLIVISLVALMSVLGMHAWFITSLQYDIVIQRELWHKNFYATETVLNIGLVQVSRQFAVLSQRLGSAKGPISIDLSTFFQNNKPGASGIDHRVLVQRCNDALQPDTLLVRALHMEGKICRCQLSCLLKKVSRDPNSKEIDFVASHFTIGNGV